MPARMTADQRNPAATTGREANKSIAFNNSKRRDKQKINERRAAAENEIKPNRTPGSPHQKMKRASRVAFCASPERQAATREESRGAKVAKDPTSWRTATEENSPSRIPNRSGTFRLRWESNPAPHSTGADAQAKRGNAQQDEHAIESPPLGGA